jgi:hypothetical protein
LTKKVRKEVSAMARTTYQVILSADGNHKVTASTDDPAELKESLDSAKNVYEWMEYFIQQGELHRIKDVIPGKAQPEQASESSAAPLCGIHQKSMKWVDKNGGFWSCHEKNEDGSWCKYRPARSA